MTYNEWRDELKSNLLCVSEQERARVLDYYAEAYADRRDAGYSEKEITAEFGAPYDAARRILSESDDALEINQPHSSEEYGENLKAKDFEDCKCSQSYGQGSQVGVGQDLAQYSKQSTSPKEKNRSWIFVLICVLLALPIFGIITAMVGVTVSFCVTPIALLIASLAALGGGVVELFSNVASGAVTIGAGLALLGVSMIIMPLFFMLVKLMWKLFICFFAWLKGLFDGKEKRI